MASLLLKLLGGFAACSASGQAIEISGKKNQALVAYLALNPGKKLAREKLVGLLWSDRGDAQARSSLRQALVALRHDLAGIEPAPLFFEGDTVAIVPSAVSTDAATFERLAASKSADELRQAAALYKGDLMDGLAVRDPAFDEWLSVERGRLHETAIDALGKLLGHLKDAEAVAAGQRLVALDPLREASHRALMKVYASQGQSGLAIRQYQTCRDTLRRELQVEPSAEIEVLYRQIQQGNYHRSMADKENAEPNAPAAAIGNTDLPTVSKPSIAVLPFANLSGDPGQEYFSDGITEDIITELSRFRNLFVIARHSSFAYKPKEVGIDVIARELGVAYVMTGSVRRVEHRVRISVQVTDVISGSHVWAERYDRELVDIFAVQEEVSLNIVGALAVELEDEFLKRARHKPPETLEAYEHWLRGKRLIFLTGNNILEAQQHFESAIAVDPGFSWAYSGLALTYQMEAFEFPLPSDARAAWEKAFKFAQKALAHDETNHQAHLALAYAHLHGCDFDQAQKHIERAMKLNPNDADTLANAAYILAAIGDPKEGEKAGRAALRLNPHNPDWYLGFLTTPLYLSQRYAEAHAIRSRVPDAFIDSTFFGAATLAHMGRLDEAKRWTDRAMVKLAATRGGALAIAEGRVVALLLENNPFCRQEDRDNFAQGMRMAGVPG